MKIIKKGNSVWVRHWFVWYVYYDNEPASVGIEKVSQVLPR